MSAQAIIDHARELGITLRANGGNLHYAPKSAAPPELVEEAGPLAFGSDNVDRVRDRRHLRPVVVIVAR